MLTSAAQNVAPSDGRRADDRQSVDRPSTFRDQHGAPQNVMVEDLSRLGCKIAGEFAVQPNSQVTIGLPGVGVAQARVVRIVPGAIGVEFLHPLSPTDLDTAFRQSPVHALQAQIMVANAGDVHVHEDRWPGAARIGVIAGGSVLLWGAIIATVRGLF